MPSTIEAAVWIAKNAAHIPASSQNRWRSIAHAV
jgi:hypothetical protein